MANFESTYSGRGYSLKNGEVYELGSDGQMRWAGAMTGTTSTVVLTGWTYTTPSGTKMYQTSSGGYIDLADGWQWAKTVTRYPNQAQALVNKIITNNKKILEHNLICARFANKLSTSEKQLLYDLQSRVTARSQALQNDGLCTGIETSYPKGYVYLEDYMTSFMAAGRVSMATWVIVVVAATVIASLSTAAYFAYQYFASESEKDVKFSEDLTRTLVGKLTEEEYQQLLSETKGIVTKARIKQSLSNYGSIVSYSLIAVGAAMLYRVIKERV